MPNKVVLLFVPEENVDQLKGEIQALLLTNDMSGQLRDFMFSAYNELTKGRQ